MSYSYENAFSSTSGAWGEWGRVSGAIAFYKRFAFIEIPGWLLLHNIIQC